MSSLLLLRLAASGAHSPRDAPAPRANVLASSPVVLAIDGPAWPARYTCLVRRAQAAGRAEFMGKEQVMDTDAGVLRSANSLLEAETALQEFGAVSGAAPSTEDWETANIHQIASVLVRHALIRTETRGSHWREDFPDRDDERWRLRLVTSVDDDGNLRTIEEPVTGEIT